MFLERPFVATVLSLLNHVVFMDSSFNPSLQLIVKIYIYLPLFETCASLDGAVCKGVFSTDNPSC